MPTGWATPEHPAAIQDGDVADFDGAAARYDQAVDDLTAAIDQLPPSDAWTVRRRALDVQTAHNATLLAVVEMLEQIRDRHENSGGSGTDVQVSG